MAYFIVIGTNDKVKNVVDEIAKSHQLQNIVSTGCIVTREDGGLTYKWTPLNGKEEDDKGQTYDLPVLLANHIADFKTVLPKDETPKVMIVSNCMDEDDYGRLEWILTDLINTPGKTFAAIQIEIALIGYDLSKENDVTLRPSWKVLKHVKELLDRYMHQANLLYINNVDYFGAKTDVNDKLLGRFLSHWGMMADSGHLKPTTTDVYSIGIAEYQYNFEDLVKYFELDAEERVIDRKLNSTPSAATQALIDKKKCLEIDTHLPWLDGLNSIKGLWKGYFKTENDFTKTIEDQPHCLQKQINQITQYLNDFLKIYVEQKKEELSILQEELSVLKAERDELNEELEAKNNEIKELGEENEETSEDLNTQKAELQKALDEKEKDITEKEMLAGNAEREIIAKSYIDADEIHYAHNPETIITDDEEEAFEQAKNRLTILEENLISDEYVNIIKRIVGNDGINIPHQYPQETVDNIGRLEPVQVGPIGGFGPPPPPPPPPPPGCAFRLFSLFFRKKTENTGNGETSEIVVAPMPKETKPTPQEVSKAIKALKETVPNVRGWWKELNEVIQTNKDRQKECKQRIDKYWNEIPNHRKSKTLINMPMVEDFRAGNADYRLMTNKVLETWFDATIKLEERPTLEGLITEKVTTPLKNKYSILLWDGENPFVKEEMTDDEVHEIVEHTLNQSKPFVQYEKIGMNAIGTKISDAFFFNHPAIEKGSTAFWSKYHTSSQSVVPNFNKDFTNSLCAVQVLGIDNIVNDIFDFKPKRETDISPAPADPNFQMKATEIIDGASEPKEIARKIYDWLCDNIQYDITKTIHDADTCWRSKKGVCQAYCELFCHIAGDRLTAEVVVGKCKQTDGTVSETLHAWLFVYTNDYDGIFIDPTWGAGGINDGRFVQSVDRDVWFDVAPAWMIYTHYPDKEEWRKLDIEVDAEAFSNLPFRIPKTSDVGLDTLTYDLSKL